MNDNRIYYIRIRGRVIGPKQLPDMQQLARRAQLNSRTPVSQDGLSWATAADFPEIFTRTTATAAPDQQLETTADAATAVVAEEWYFAINGKQHPSPVSLATLQSYVQSGTLASGDLVFRSGWDNWRPVNSVPELTGIAPRPQVSNIPVGPTQNQPSGGSAPWDYAEYMPRVGAFLLDALFVICISGIPQFGIFFLAGLIGTASGDEQGALVMINLGQVCGQLVGIVIGWLYFALQDSSQKQGTFGKQIVGIKVTDLQGNRISFGRATGRYFAKWITGCTCGIGLLMPLWTEKKQTLHDMIAGCLALKK